jgi:hypothetical protein
MPVLNNSENFKAIKLKGMKHKGFGPTAKIRISYVFKHSGYITDP